MKARGWIGEAIGGTSLSLTALKGKYKVAKSISVSHSLSSLVIDTQ
jgi:hypothetical protein